MLSMSNPVSAPSTAASQSSEVAKEAPASDTLSHDELMKYIGDLVIDLKSWETFNNSEVLEILKNIGKTYWLYKDDRKAVGNRLAQCGFSDFIDGCSLSAHVVKMIEWFNEAGVFKTDDIWFPTYYSFSVCWNFTDASRDLALDLGSAGLVKICSLNIQHSPYLENSESKNVVYILKSSLSILQNMCKLSELKNLFDEENVKDALKPFLAHENEFFRAVATMILTSIISEEENTMLSDTGSIEFIVKAIREALTRTKNRRYRGFSPLELVECLGRMAVNDENKKSIVAFDALPLLVILLQGKDEEEQLAAAKTIWTLAFDKEVLEKIKSEPGCTDSLEKLTQSSNARVKKAAKGALWMFKDNSVPQQNLTKETTVKEKGHIFISYSWSQQDEIIQIKDALKAAGYKVWIDLEQMEGSTLESMAVAVENATLNAGYRVWLDIDNMEGSTLEAMALAVESASVILLCASQNYKISPNCRTEAEYTFQLKKPIVPLMLQRKYKADGWLGMIMGAKLYINFDGKYPFEKAFAMLEKELQGRGKEGASEDFVDAPIVKQEVNTTSTHTPMSYTTPEKDGVSTWNEEQVGQWLEKYKLESKKDSFAGYDGPLFSNLIVVRQEAPEFFYKFLKEDLHLNLLEISKLIHALDSLP